MRLQEAVEVLPAARDPLDDPLQFPVPTTRLQLALDEPAPQEAPQEPLDRLRVVGQKDPPDSIHLRR